MPLDDLVSVIETLQQRIRDHGASLRENETRTRMALIDPLLTALGWDVSDPALVTPEYNVSGRWADYALLRPDGQPAATIEAKKLSESLASHRMQMLNYSNASGVEYAGLTDGDRWELYEVFQRGQLEDRRILDVSIANTPAHELALKMLLLWRPNLASGKPIEANGPILNVEPSVIDEIISHQMPSPVQPGWMALSSLNPRTGDASPRAIRFSDGSEHRIQAWRYIIVHSAAWLWSKGLLTHDNVPVPWGRTRYIVNVEPVHRTGTPFASSVTVNGTPLFAECDVRGIDSVNNAVTLLNHCGIDPDTVQLQVEQ